VDISSLCSVEIFAYDGFLGILDNLYMGEEGNNNGRDAHGLYFSCFADFRVLDLLQSTDFVASVRSQDALPGLKYAGNCYVNSQVDVEKWSPPDIQLHLYSYLGMDHIGNPYKGSSNGVEAWDIEKMA
jgi:hypothetical protein